MVEQVLPTSRPLDAFLGRGLALRIKIGRQSEAVLTDCGFFVSYAKACGVYRMWKPVKVLETGCLGRCIFHVSVRNAFAAITAAGHVITWGQAAGPLWMARIDLESSS